MLRSCLTHGKMNLKDLKIKKSEYRQRDDIDMVMKRVEVGQGRKIMMHIESMNTMIIGIHLYLWKHKCIPK